jgi:hypothetical protein
MRRSRGALTVNCFATSQLTLQWQLGDQRARLEVDFAVPHARLVWSTAGGTRRADVDLGLAELG